MHQLRKRIVQSHLRTNTVLAGSGLRVLGVLAARTLAGAGLAVLSACSSAGGDAADGELGGYRLEPFQPGLAREDLTTGQMIFECERHLRAWQQALAAPRNKENLETVDFLERATTALVHRERLRLEAQAISGPPRNRAVASAALGFSRNPNSLSAIANNLSDSDPTVRANALLGVGIMASPDTPLEPIYAAVMDATSPDMVLRNAAYAGYRLASAGHEDTGGTLTAIFAPLLSHPEGPVRAQAASGLGLMRSTSMLPRLNTLATGDQDSMVRTAAVFALGEIGSAASTKILIEALQDTNRLVAGTARGSLTKIHGKDLGSSPADWRKEYGG
ncbi:MAG TPA: HEAT repeat domain-containing protein [Planctomycetota bacterium]